MDESLISATVKVLVENIIAVAAEELRLKMGFKNELTKLKKSFEMIQPFLYDAERRQVEDEAVELWLKNLEDVAYEAENLLDELKYEILRRNQMNRKVFFFFFSFTNPFPFRSKMTRKMKDVNMKLKMVNKEATSHGLHQRHDPYSIISLPPNIHDDESLIEIDPIVIGRENDVSNIVDMLVNPSDELVSVIPIVGESGIGKTTLARLIFNDQRTMKRFDRRIWVCVSERFDTIKISIRILHSLGINIVRRESKDAIIDTLKYKLKDKRYLLVLDDMKNESRRAWADFENSLLGINSNKGNFIIVTTRSKLVASIMNPGADYPLSKLSDDSCWSIIKTRAFSRTEISKEFEASGMKIACRCMGIPLAANLIGATLQGKGEKEWTSILQSEFSNSNREESGVLQVLKVGFNHLPSPLLQKCFEFFSILRKGEEIEKEWLIQLWMAEGFLLENDGNEMESLGNRIYYSLLHKSFLHEAVKDMYGNIKHCKMHDVMHDLACLVSNRESFGRENRKAEHCISKIRHFCGEAVHKIKKDEAIYARTLFLASDVPDNVLLQFKSLRILNLKETNIDEVTTSINKLIHLRFFDVSSTKIKALPESLCQLFNLQTLRLIKCFSLEGLPSQFQQLVSLRYLMIGSAETKRFEMPLELGKLTCLRTLKFFNAGHEKGRRIEELGSLNKLKGKLEIRNLERVNDKEEASTAHLIEKPNINQLALVWSDSRDWCDNDEKVLEGLQPHPNIKCLTIDRFGGDKFPQWTMKMIVAGIRLENLIKISLIDCENCQELPTLGHLPLLKILELEGLQNVKSIGPSFYYLHDWSESSRKDYGYQHPSIVFQSLQHFTIKDMPNLIEWVEAKDTVFPCLEILEIYECYSMSRAPSRDFPSLKELTIVDSTSILLAKICGSNLRSLENMKVSGISDLINLPERLFYNNQSLAGLDLSDCPNLTVIELPNDGRSARSLERLTVINCPELMSIQYSSPQIPVLTSLRRLEIDNCTALTSLPGEMLEFCTSLEVLVVSDCTNLVSFPVECHRMPNLYHLAIDRCKKISCPKGMDYLRVLTKLSFGQFSEELGLALISEALQCMRGLQSLRELTIFGYPEWDFVPDELQHLRYLTYLDLNDFGIEVLPEWFGKFSSLEILHLWRLKRLRHFPSKEAMKRLTKLKILWIFSCPLFAENCSEEQSNTGNDSEWSKISHIPEVIMH